MTRLQEQDHSHTPRRVHQWREEWGPEDCHLGSPCCGWWANAWVWHEGLQRKNRTLGE